MPNSRPRSRNIPETRVAASTSVPAGAPSAVEGTADLIARLVGADAPPFAVLHRPEADPEVAEILLGDLVTVEKLAELPEPVADDLPVLAVVPFRQIRERGF